MNARTRAKLTRGERRILWITWGDRAEQVEAYLVPRQWWHRDREDAPDTPAREVWHVPAYENKPGWVLGKDLFPTQRDALDAALAIQYRLLADVQARISALREERKQAADEVHGWRLRARYGAAREAVTQPGAPPLPFPAVSDETGE